MPRTTPKRRRCRLQYRLRTLLGLTALVALGLGIWAAYIRPFRAQAAAARELLAIGAKIETRPGAPAWMCRLFGERHFQDVVAVDLEHRGFKADDLAPLAHLEHLERLYLAASDLDDEGLAHIAGLKSLKRLSLWKTAITDRGARRLEGLASLEVLDIDDTRLTQDCLVHFGGMKRLKKLNFWFWLDDEGLRRLVDLPSLRKDGYEDLMCKGVTAEGVYLLPLFYRVRRLTLADCAEVTDAEFEIVARLPRLERLSVTRTPVSDAALAAVAQTRCQELGLSETGVTLREVVDAFGARTRFVYLSPTCVELSSFRVYNETLGLLSHGVKARSPPMRVTLSGPIPEKDLSQLQRARDVRAIVIRGFEERALTPVGALRGVEEMACDIPLGDAGLARVARLAALRILVLGRLGPVTPEGTAALGNLRRLEELRLQKAGLRDEHLAFLAELHDLRVLSLGENPIVGPGLRHVAGLAKLESLWFVDCSQLTDAGMEHLAGLANLRSLCIQYTQVTDEGLKHLYRLPRLRDVSMLGSRVTEQGRIDLRRALGLNRVLF